MTSDGWNTSAAALVGDWDTTAAAVIRDWDAAQQWSDITARQVQQAADGRRAVELLRQALARTALSSTR